MNCAEVGELLSGLVYGEPSSESGAAAAHLEECSACRAEREALIRVREALDAADPPAGGAVQQDVDLPDLYRRAIGLERRQARRWRGAAAAVAALAACVLAALALRVEVRGEAGQLVIRWGEARETNPQHDQAIAMPTEVQPNPTAAAAARPIDDQLRLLHQMVHALAIDIDARDSRQRQQAARLQARLDEMQQRAVAGMAASRRDLNALYAAQFTLSPKRGTP